MADVSHFRHSPVAIGLSTTGHAAGLLSTDHRRQRRWLADVRPDLTALPNDRQAWSPIEGYGHQGPKPSVGRADTTDQCKGGRCRNHLHS
jgi:hypothetical protein